MNANSTADEVYERIRREHEMLKEQLGHIHHLLGTHNTSGKAVAVELQHFHAALVDHFYSEEQEGFFTEVTAQAPNLTPQAHKLCREHQTMLHTVMELARFAAAGAESTTWWRELQTRFQALSKQLMHHESEENSLLQQAYQEDLGQHD